MLLERIARLSARIADPATDREVKATLVARRDAARSQLANVRATKAQVDAEARNATIQLTIQTPQSSAVPVAPSRFDDAGDRAVESSPSKRWSSCTRSSSSARSRSSQSPSGSAGAGCGAGRTSGYWRRPDATGASRRTKSSSSDTCP